MITLAPELADEATSVQFNNEEHMTRLLSCFVLSACLSVTLLQASSNNPEHEAAFKATKSCPSCDLRNAQLGGIQAPGANLVNADLSDASLYGGNLRGADLTGAILNGTRLEMADLNGATGAILGAAITDSRTTCPDGSHGPCK